MEPLPKNDQVYYIKLGERGYAEQKCIEQNQTIRIGWHNWNHEDCLQKRWAEVQKFSLTQYNNNKKKATKATNAIRRFYELDSHALWITFYGNSMWWCYAEVNVEKAADGEKTRKVIGQWMNTDINGKRLSLDSLSGQLLKMRRFQGTICHVNEWGYVFDRINGNPSEAIKQANTARASFCEVLLPLVKKLTWGDFEILVDLIFTRAGWQRVSELGKTQKTIDSSLRSPVTNERAMLQVKSESTQQEFESYVSKFKNEMKKDYERMFYVVHSPDGSLSKASPPSGVRLITGKELCELIIDGGLSSWVISKSS